VSFSIISLLVHCILVVWTQGGQLLRRHHGERGMAQPTSVTCAVLRISSQGGVSDVVNYQEIAREIFIRSNYWSGELKQIT
jgi:hypothetical protein